MSDREVKPFDLFRKRGYVAVAIPIEDEERVCLVWLSGEYDTTAYLGNDQYEKEYLASDSWTHIGNLADALHELGKKLGELSDE